jgi:hypothetical protein
VESTPVGCCFETQNGFGRVLLWVGNGFGVKIEGEESGSGQGIWVGFPWFCKQFHRLSGSWIGFGIGIWC